MQKLHLHKEVLNVVWKDFNVLAPQRPLIPFSPAGNICTPLLGRVCLLLLQLFELLYAEWRFWWRRVSLFLPTLWSSARMLWIREQLWSSRLTLHEYYIQSIYICIHSICVLKDSGCFNEGEGGQQQIPPQQQWFLQPHRNVPDLTRGKVSQRMICRQESCVL